MCVAERALRGGPRRAEAVDNPFDRYQLPLPGRLQTHLVEIDSGQEVAALQGFDLSWCQVPPG